MATRAGGYDGFEGSLPGGNPMSQGIDRSVQIKLVVAIVLILLILIVVLQNTAPVETRILFMSLEMPQAALLSLTLLIGLLAGSLVTLVVIRRERKNKQL